MRLVRFRIRDYKSVLDSGDCWLASDLTVLAGKNESGKTAVLEALRDFDRESALAPGAQPIDREGRPSLELVFEATNAELDALLDGYSKNLTTAVRPLFKRDGIVLVKDHVGVYAFAADVQEAIAKIDAQEAERAAQEAAARAEKARQAAEEAERLAALRESWDRDSASEEGEAQSEDPEALEDSEDETDGERPMELESSVQMREPLLTRVVNALPTFVFFSSFEDVLPFEITLARSRSNQAVLDFAAVAGLDLDLVASTNDTQARRNLLAAHSAEISGDFKGYWRQDAITLAASTEGQTLIIAVHEDGRTHGFKVEQRSKGFQWFLSFYLRLKASGESSRVILIDEPGLYLHARAQADVLDVLENLARTSQVVFSTHSPYLLDPNRFDRIRLVVKDETQGTLLLGKVHSEADAETLTPIITALGLDVSRGLVLSGLCNLLVEGITDYYLLQVLATAVPRKLRESFQEVSVIPAVGAQNVPLIASLLTGWGLDFIAMVDRDREGNDVAKKLEAKLGVEASKVVRSVETEGGAIEDVFSQTDFDARFLPDGRPSGVARNSEALKRSGVDRVLSARRVADDVRGKSPKWTDETKANARRLLTALLYALSSKPDEPSQKTDAN